ncbi:hypothetical protein F2Q69_00007227 [Brassica cretica]|uniref:Uncharacterized protein n=1 Tax=Brassica cretica TaxID=69181 RepID=A0A8S9P085_BRACR|nr:hypothetical protein F2Q69_00007227 [Brassica cretica]
MSSPPQRRFLASHGGKRLATLIFSISNNSQVCNSGGIASTGTLFSHRISSATSPDAVVLKGMKITGDL